MVFGPRRTFAASLVLFTMAHVILLVLALEEILPHPLGALTGLYAIQLFWSFQALNQGLSYASVSRLQTRYRVLYAVIGLAMVVALFGFPVTTRA